MSRSPILLVEDDAEVAQALRMVLVGAGYPVKWVRSGDEGLEAVSLGRNTPVVLLDLGLPDMTAVQFGTRLNGYHARPPLILMTGSSQDTLDDAAAALRAQAALRKPFDAKVLLRTVEAAMERRRDEAVPAWALPPARTA